MTLLDVRGLDISVAGRTLVRSLDLSVSSGSVTALLGRNGAGKTLTLHTLCGLRAAEKGSISVAGQSLAQWPRKELARKLGLLAQTTEDPFPSTVMETALIGRHPHIDFWQWESDIDRSIAGTALEAVDLAGFAARDISTLSGGERRRAAIATLLAQDPELFLLDEPINHLDPPHQLDALRLFRARADAGRAVIMSLHDAGLAARFSDQAVLLFGDGDWLCGPTREILTETNIGRLYGVAVREVSWEGGRTFVAV
ncbi:iron complex transport system ATP-binding protein [Povalibacter uvarum]|uniref:Iron complex transport system ATP-binding protein n=1 Tax=Povalibacter uvarum TaxID=732238 RepID=A0A841HNL2_9GAMM|nr:ABC transporter ATP-binding protein [Povalibacter uvarum]MBB6094881.1 iron complex transport system ATP-binding protein [Povalibacter uvarum]